MAQSSAACVGRRQGRDEKRISTYHSFSSRSWAARGKCASAGRHISQHNELPHAHTETDSNEPGNVHAFLPQDTQGAGRSQIQAGQAGYWSPPLRLRDVH